MVDISFCDLHDPPAARSQERTDAIEVHYIALQTRTIVMDTCVSGHVGN